ncbi:hypothetical protein [Chryseobacterium gleum]|uniref:hypothetical protein n=1 Tax=Chryseobacterium gleum TaxID=250 RepID=UPI0031D8E36F
MEEYIKIKLLELGLIDVEFYNNIISVRIDEIDKDYLKELYQLRMNINIEKKNQEGADFSKEYLSKILASEGDKLLSIIIKTSNTSKSFFSNKDMSFFW